jgi:hypothetical protein
VELHIVEVGDDLVDGFAANFSVRICLGEQIVWFKEQHPVGLLSAWLSGGRIGIYLHILSFM